VEPVRPWKRLTLRGTQPDFVDIVKRAQPYCPRLRRLRIMSWMSHPPVDADDTGSQNVVILADPDLVEFWEEAADGEIRLEYMAEGDIIHAALDALREEGLLPDSVDESGTDIETGD